MVAWPPCAQHGPPAAPRPEDDRHLGPEDDRHPAECPLVTAPWFSPGGNPLLGYALSHADEPGIRIRPATEVRPFLLHTPDVSPDPRTGNLAVRPP